MHHLPGLLSGPAKGVGLALLLSAGQLASEEQAPPSSLPEPGATVRVVHRHERVTDCKMQAGSDVCHEHRELGRAGAELTLTPLESDLVARPRPNRAEVHLSLSNDQGVTSAELRLASGDWRLTWEDRWTDFRVNDGVALQVRLSTISGACVLARGRCERNSEAVRKSISVPVGSKINR